MEETKLYKLLNLAEVDKLFSAYQKNGMLMDGSIEDLRCVLILLQLILFEMCYLYQFIQID